MEVRHNSIKLKTCRHYIVHNPVVTEARLERFSQAKLPRGFKLRYVVDRDRHMLELSERNELNVDMAERVLRAAGLIKKEIPWTNFFQKSNEEFAWR